MTNPTEKKYTKEYCKYKFTPEEVAEMSAEMAQNVSTLKDAESDKKAIMSDLKGKIDGLTAQTQISANKINNGYEMRNVECLVEFDYANGVVRHTRTDTWETVKTRQMTADDRQMEMGFAEQGQALEQGRALVKDFPKNEEPDGDCDRTDCPHYDAKLEFNCIGRGPGSDDCPNKRTINKKGGLKHGKD